MNSRFLVFLATGLALAGAGCSPETPPAPPAARAKAPAPLWSPDVSAALKQAGRERKDILLYFSGLDWAPWCATLNKEVFDTPDFRSAAPQSFVLVDLDFPQHRPPPSRAIAAQNAQWLQKCGIPGFPTVVLADADGRPYAQLGYLAGGAANYLRVLDQLRVRRRLRDEKWAAAAKVEGPEKALRLDEGLRALEDDEIVLRHYRAEIKQIIALDPTGSAKGYFERMVKDVAASKKIEELKAKAHQNPEKTIGQLVVLASGDGISREVKQRALLYAFRICQVELKDAARAEKIFDAALAADPESEATAKLRAAKAQLLGGQGAGPKKPANFVERRN